jgi:ribosomal protein L24E
MYDVPHGMTVVLVNGDLMYFCSSKCRKNKVLGRKKEKQKWVMKSKTTVKNEKVEKKSA